MVDDPWHDVLNEKKDSGAASVFMTHVPLQGKFWHYKVNLEAMTQTRMWKGQANGNERPLKRVTMIEIEGSQPTKDLPDGCDVRWQYKGNWGWKNFAPIPNADVVRAQGEGKSSIVVTHVWLHYKHDVPSREGYEVDFESMMQTAQNKQKTKRQVRLVALVDKESGVALGVV